MLCILLVSRNLFDWDTHFTNLGSYSLQIHLERLALVSVGRPVCQGTASVCFVELQYPSDLPLSLKGDGGIKE
jgi:hypothetical protein